MILYVFQIVTCMYNVVLSGGYKAGMAKEFIWEERLLLLFVLSF